MQDSNAAASAGAPRPGPADMFGLLPEEADGSQEEVGAVPEGIVLIRQGEPSTAYLAGWLGVVRSQLARGKSVTLDGNDEWEIRAILRLLTPRPFTPERRRGAPSVECLWDRWTTEGPCPGLCREVSAGATGRPCRRSWGPTRPAAGKPEATWAPDPLVDRS